jgi:hypothetical protein
VKRLPPVGGVRDLSQHGEREPQLTGGGRHHRERQSPRRGLGDHGCIGAISPLHRRADADVVVHALLADDRFQDQVAAQPYATSRKRARGERLGNDARLHIGRAAAPNPVAIDVAREWVVAPVVLPTGGHDVDVAVEDQRAALARPPDNPHGVLAPGFQSKHVHVGVHLPVDLGNQQRDPSLPANKLVIALAGIPGVDTRNLHCSGDRPDELVASSFDFSEHSLDHLGPSSLLL